MPSRRGLLAACTAGVASIAGCSTLVDRSGEGTPSRADSPPRTASPTDRSPAGPARIGTTRGVGDATVTVTAATSQTSVVHRDSPDSMAVAVPRDRFVLVGLGATAPSPAIEDFALVAGDRAFGASRVGFGSLRVRGERKHVYRGGSDRSVQGFLAFEVPAPLSVGSARVECRDATWELPGEVLAALRRPTPAWALESFDVPDPLRAGETATVSATFHNTGDVDGRFRGALNVANLNYAYVPYPFSVRVAAGERGTWTRELSVPADATERSPGFYLRTPAGSRERAVEVDG